MADYLKLAQAPEFVLHYPTCSTCDVDLDHDGDGWTCPTCGTAWDRDASDGDKGELYASWSGEDLSGPALSTDDAERISFERQREESKRRLASIGIPA